jgi:hypothetical protein
MADNGRKKRDDALALALAAGQTVRDAAAAAGVSERTATRRLTDPGFRKRVAALRAELVQAAVARLQSSVGQAVDTLAAVAKEGKKDGDRVRAAVAILDSAFRGLGASEPADTPEIDGTAGVVRVLAERLAQLDAADLPTPEKARLTATLAEALLRAIGVSVLDKRLEALQAVLLTRKETK